FAAALARADDGFGRGLVADRRPSSCPRLWNRDIVAVLNFKHIVDGPRETVKTPERFLHAKPK
ncbi:hypothetical protein LPJ61_006119, partial [Coemansia biformis]